MPNNSALCSISVIIPVYNASRFLPTTLDTLSEQDFTDFEAICIDDGSSDGSLGILEAYSQKLPSLRVLSRPNTGIVGALNDGLQLVRGEFIARLDADDLCAPDRFRKQLDFLQARPDVVAVGSSAKLIDEASRPIGVFPVPEGHEEIVARLLRGASAIHHPSVMMRTESVREVGGYREGYCPAEDYDLWLRLSEIGKLANLSESLITKRQTISGLVVSKLTERDAVVNRSLNEAWVRRELPGAPPSAEPTFGSTIDVYHQWVWLALRHGHVATARYYALRAYALRPTELRSLRLLGCAIRGY